NPPAKRIGTGVAERPAPGALRLGSSRRRARSPPAPPRFPSTGRAPPAQRQAASLRQPRPRTVARSPWHGCEPPPARGSRHRCTALPSSVRVPPSRSVDFHGYRDRFLLPRADFFGADEKRELRVDLAMSGRRGEERDFPSRIGDASLDWPSLDRVFPAQPLLSRLYPSGATLEPERRVAGGVRAVLRLDGNHHRAFASCLYLLGAARRGDLVQGARIDLFTLLSNRGASDDLKTCHQRKGIGFQ